MAHQVMVVLNALGREGENHSVVSVNGMFFWV